MNPGYVLIPAFDQSIFNFADYTCLNIMKGAAPFVCIFANRILVALGNDPFAFMTIWAADITGVGLQ